MTPTTGRIGDKFASSDLREFATAGGDGLRSVIVELDDSSPFAPPPAVHLPGRDPKRIRHLPDTSGVAAAKLMDDLERDLTALHPDVGPIRNDLARAFFVTVTPSVLRAIEQLPHIRVIRPRLGTQSVATAGG